MAYQFKKKQTFSAIESDKQHMSDVHNSEKIKMANAVFGGEVDLIDILPDSKPIQINAKENGIVDVDINLIKARSANEFEEISNETLKQSIASLGIMFPLLLRTSDNGKYTIISGHRRYGAAKEILANLKIKKAEQEKEGIITQEINEQIKKFSTVPALVFTVVEEGSELLGTNPKYITNETEEEMYQASNLENRQINKESIFNNISYFYRLIKTKPGYEQELLERRNANSKRKASKLNMPEEISRIVTEVMNYNVKRTYIYRVVSIMEAENDYPQYQKIALQRIKNGEPVRRVYDDFNMAVAIHEANFEDVNIKKEYHNRIEKSDEPIEDIYNELFDIKKKKKALAKNTVPKSFVEKLLNEVKENKLTIDNAIKKLQNY